LSVAIALIGDPKIVYLDEPVSKYVVHKYIKSVCVIISNLDIADCIASIADSGCRIGSNAKSTWKTRE
jgi:ABC-type branched-subunit amino acid transport system ATPase component